MTNMILNRRSIRKYLPDKVDGKAVDQLVAAFQASPCGMHQTDVMAAIVVGDDQLRQQIEAATDNACYQAPLLFVITTKKDSQFGERDASVAAENVMLAATELGLGSVYVMGGAIKLAQHPRLLSKLGVKTGFAPTVIVPVGTAAEEAKDEDRSSRYQVLRK